jgi:hypothetical protein
MKLIVALFVATVGLLFVGYVTLQYAIVSAAITRQEDTRPTELPPAPNLTTIPAHRLLVRCLGDVDDFLDSINDSASFEAVKPHILGRVRRHVAESRAYGDSGTTGLSKTASQELRKAADRHSQALGRAIRVVPAVRGFFDKDVATALDGK